MNRVSSYYCLKLKHKHNQVFKLTPTIKYGNCDVMNYIFENWKEIEFKKIGLDCEESGYFGYMFKFLKDGRFMQGIFESNSLIFPYGVVRVCGKTHTIFFKVDNELNFQVLVFNDNDPNACQYLQLFADGYLNEEIEFLETNFQLLTETTNTTP